MPELETKYGELLSDFGFNFNLRRYTQERLENGVDKIAQASAQVADLQLNLKQEQAGAYTRPHLTT